MKRASIRSHSCTLRTKKRKERPFSGNFSELDSLVWMLSEREMWDGVIRTQQGYHSLFSLGISVNNFSVFFNGREEEWTLKAEQQRLTAAFGLHNTAHSASGYNCKMLLGVKELHPFGTTQKAQWCRPPNMSHPAPYLNLTPYVSFIYYRSASKRKLKSWHYVFFSLLLTALLEIPGDICWIRLRHFTMVQTEGIKFQGHECLTSMDGMKD